MSHFRFFESSAARRFVVLLSMLLVAAAFLCGCTSIERYRDETPSAGSTALCSDGDGIGVVACDRQTTERHANYTMHVVEFDDEGWPFKDKAASGSDAMPLSQMDAAIAQIKDELLKDSPCVRLFIYVHGWQHNAAGEDPNVRRFRDFLDKVAARSASGPEAAATACAVPIQVKDAKSSASTRAAATMAKPPVVGLYVGWRGLSLQGIPFKYASFWDRKNTAERVAQGSVRELFGRIGAIVEAQRPAAAPGSLETLPSRLRVYVIGHSFGASVVFRAISQALIESFSGGLDDDKPAPVAASTSASAPAPAAAAAASVPPTATASIPRSFDMVVLVNPAIEAARFDPVFRAASKRAVRCGAAPGCTQPPYQAPVLAIFTSEGDKATQLAFPVGAVLGNIFEKATTPEESRAIHKTIGWDDDYVTHELKLSDCALDAGVDGDPSEATPADPSGARRYRAPGWTWCFADKPQFHFALTQVPKMPGKTAAGPTYNGPLWNVRVSSEVISNHGDIWNEKFTDVLFRFFADAGVHPIALASPPTP